MDTEKKSQIAEAAAVYRVSPTVPMPKVEIHKTAQQRIKLSEMQALLPPLYETLTRAATEYGIPVKRIVVTNFPDPEEGEIELAVRQCVDASFEQILKYWDELEPYILEWRASLSERQKAYADHNISTIIQQDGHDYRF